MKAYFHFSKYHLKIIILKEDYSIYLSQDAFYIFFLLYNFPFLPSGRKKLEKGIFLDKQKELYSSKNNLGYFITFWFPRHNMMFLNG